MNIPDPEKFLKERFLHELPHERILNNFPCEIRWLNEYKTVILDEYDKDFNKVMGRVNFLMRACLKQDQKSIDEFLTDFGKVYNDDSFGLDFNKIIDGK